MGLVYAEDVDALARDGRIDWKELEGRDVVITGSTGLIGGLGARALMRHTEITDAPAIRLTLLVRDEERARRLLGDDGNLRYVRWDANVGAVPDILDASYILHCASNTDSARMVTHPLETIRTTVAGTEAMLELARRTKARMVFVSSMEVYGAGSERTLTEADGGALDAMNGRSSYPQAKQLAETLCAAYASEYDTQVSVARLAQTFGAGIRDTDNRIFCEIARRCRSDEDIELATDGSKRNMYCYTRDAVCALLMLLTKGLPQTAYNVANEDTFCSVLEMAQMAANRFSKTTAVHANVNPKAASKYAVTGSIRLDTTRISKLGWEPTFGLLDMFQRMMDDWQDAQGQA